MSAYWVLGTVVSAGYTPRSRRAKSCSPGTYTVVGRQIGNKKMYARTREFKITTRKTAALGCYRAALGLCPIWGMRIQRLIEGRCSRPGIHLFNGVFLRVVIILFAN